MPGGRPTKYKKEFADELYKVTQLMSGGVTNEKLAEYFGVSVATIDNWRRNHPEFLSALKDNKDELDADVERSLYERATGYRVVERQTGNGPQGPFEKETVKLVPPDPTAMIFWLKNRQPQRWRDKQEVAHSGAIEVGVEFIDGKDSSD